MRLEISLTTLIIDLPLSITLHLGGVCVQSFTFCVKFGSL